MPPKKPSGLADFTTAPVEPAAPSAATPKPTGDAVKSLTIRLDRDRWLRMKEFLAHNDTSAQELLVSLLDERLDFTKPRKTS